MEQVVDGGGAGNTNGNGGLELLTQVQVVVVVAIKQVCTNSYQVVVVQVVVILRYPNSLTITIGSGLTSRLLQQMVR